ncbi:FtsK/SpoIIIE domain-containing protein [Paracidovorax wautersii]|uniref:TraM recognition site of TraD and TraG n=1 Tax=Paracidovorax wautersii TaxID=1177982 RepID=A0A1I2I059_9BURK|nr:FtsK/SpoIIIE domain-containing protein [Paracidovorax wautersii]SFF33971.1 TraM recognition site of TraD and TraG [Paracidovorax wautersii]
MARRFEGLDSSSEISELKLREDLRPLSVKLRDWWLTPDGQTTTLMCMLGLAVIGIWAPFAGEVVLLLVLGFSALQLNYKKRKWDFPLRVPMSAGLIDGSTNKEGKGIMFVGNEIGSGLPASISDNDARTHALIFGTTGSGKTVFLMGFVFCSLVYNGGASYTDGKGDVKLWLLFMNACRMLGREDDLLLISFITSGHEFYDRQETKISNTINPYANGSSGMCTEASISLMDSGGGDDMWKGRAIAFLGGLIKPLVFLRDQGEVLLDAELIRDYFDLPKLEKFVWDENDIWKGGLNREQGYFSKKYGKVWKAVIRPLEAFMTTIPGYDRSRLGKQEQKTLEQHGYITMQLARLFGDLADNYGHIMKTPLGEVDMYDVVINDRILVTLLPALERSPESLGMLGKIIVGGIKQMAAGCLGNKVEGLRREIVEARPTNSPVPFPTIFDEYGYYAVLGFSSMPAQARSLGFMVVFAAQDFASLKKSSPEEADQTWENTNLRGIGRITSGTASETYKRMVELGGTANVAEVSGWEIDRTRLVSKLRASEQIKITEKPRVNTHDLHSQADGEFHLFLGKKEQGGQKGLMKIVRVNGFFSEIVHGGRRDKKNEQPNVEYLCINHFARVAPPAEIVSPATNAMIKGDNGIRAAIANDQLTLPISTMESRNPIPIMSGELYRLNSELENPFPLLDQVFAGMAYLAISEQKRKADIMKSLDLVTSSVPAVKAASKPPPIVTAQTDGGASSSGSGGPVQAMVPTKVNVPVGLPGTIGKPPAAIGKPPVGASPLKVGASPLSKAGLSAPPVVPAGSAAASSAAASVPNVEAKAPAADGDPLVLSDGDKELLAKVNLFTNGEVDIPVNSVTKEQLVQLAQDLLTAGSDVLGIDLGEANPQDVIDNAQARGTIQSSVKVLDAQAITDVILAVDPSVLSPDQEAAKRREARAFVDNMAAGSTYLDLPLPNSALPVASFKDAVDALAEGVFDGE